jgi:hypothetical protein
MRADLLKIRLFATLADSVLPAEIAAAAKAIENAG